MRNLGSYNSRPKFFLERSIRIFFRFPTRNLISSVVFFFFHHEDKGASETERDQTPATTRPGYGCGLNCDHAACRHGCPLNGTRRMMRGSNRAAGTTQPAENACVKFQRHAVVADETAAETERHPPPPAQATAAAATKMQWGQWRAFSAFALSSSSVFSGACEDEDSVSCESDGDGPAGRPQLPQRHPLEVAATERFLAADLLRRVRNAQAEMPPLTIEEKISLPGWLSWGRGSALQDTAAAGDASSPAPAVLSMQHSGGTLLAAATSGHEAASPNPRGRMSRAVRKVSKRLPNLRVMAAAALSTPALRLPTVSVPSPLSFARSDDRRKSTRACPDSPFASDPAVLISP